MNTTTSHPVRRPSETVRTVVSFLLFVHLFCVGSAFCSHLFPSELQNRLAAIVSPYTNVAGLDPTSAALSSSFHHVSPFFRQMGDDGVPLRQWQVVAGNVITRRYPGSQPRGGFLRDRYETFAQLAATYAEDELDDDLAEIAKALALQAGLGQTEHEPLRVRLVRFDDKADPVHSLVDDVGVTVLYDANVWVSESGGVHVLKRMPRHRTADPVSSSG